jgi:hypothetical protein
MRDVNGLGLAETFVPHAQDQEKILDSQFRDSADSAAHRMAR